MSRIENDFLGEKEIEEDAFYGIHSVRAKENFPSDKVFSIDWYKAIGEVKYAFYQTYKKYKKSLLKNFEEEEIPFKLLHDDIVEALLKSSQEVAAGEHYHHFIVPSDCGGAGTSLNMNVNEIIANRSLQIMGKKLGDYQFVDPLEAANIYQSTNDVVPSALKMATMRLLNDLEESIAKLRYSLEFKEKESRNRLRMGYTEMRTAVPTSFGKLFSSYQEAFSRDWWRVSKCFERIKEINLGGSAVGTGLSVPRYFMTHLITNLRSNVDLPLAKSNNFSDSTSNLDPFVEVHGMIKTLGMNLEKMVSDLRLLSSEFFTGHPLTIPHQQMGSSIMPGKVNPVMSEFVVGKVYQIYAHDNVITQLAGQGVLELNAYISQIGTLLLEDLMILIHLTRVVRTKIIDGIEFNFSEAEKEVYRSPVIVTALIPLIGHHESKKIGDYMREKKVDVFKANDDLKLINKDLLNENLEPAQLLKLGFSLTEFKKKI